MLASAWRSLTITSFGSDGEAPKVVQRAQLGSGPDAAPAVSLGWDETGSNVIVAVSSDQLGLGSQVYLRQALPQRGSSGLQGIVPVRDCGVTDLSVQSSEDDQTCWALAACTDGSTCLIDASSARAARIVQKYRCFRGVRASAVELAKNLQCFACASAAGQVLLQPLSEDNMGHSPLASSAADAEAAINSLRFSPKRSEMLAGAGANGQIQVWDINALSRVLELSAHRAAARSLSFSRHNEALLISAGSDAMLMFWDVRNGKPINEVRVEAALESVSYHADGYRVAVGTAAGTAILYDLRKMKDQVEPLQRLALHKDEGCKGLRAMAWGPLLLNRADLENTLASPRSSPLSEQADVSPTDGPTLGAPGGPALPRGMAPLDLRSGSFPASRVTRDLASEFEDMPTRGPSNSSVQELMNQLSSRKPLSAAQSQGTPVVRRVSAPDGRGTERLPSAPSSSSEVRQAAQGLQPSTPMASQRSRRWPPAEDERLNAASTREPISFSMTNNTPTPAEAFSSGGMAGSPWWSSPDSASPADARLLSEQRQRLSSAGATPVPSAGAAAASADPVSSAAAEVLARHRAQLAGGDHEDAAGVSAEGAPSGSQLPETLRPWLEELRRDLCREVREAQYCMMEQNFRLHVELRREMEELRAEVQVLRGELQAL